MERQRQPECNAAHDPAHIEHFHACHHDGQRRDDQYLPGILVLYAYADLRFRQRDRDDCYENHIHICILDTAHFAGQPDSKQYQRLLYPDLLYL